ncbi:PREDICTED: phospholipase D zeta 2 [Tarenaya hassleriana]|uniref:phospholipase D zeta 2 n=1 Tax=Tarenaya hassleriana TaxID=28532 RepID=UPI00053C3CC0|nr:PREDICTED: phospholipase D zeta 2 [Tarenaya hassleriana]
MSTEKLLDRHGVKSDDVRRTKTDAAAETPLSHGGFQIFEELPKATIVSVSRPDTADISPLLLSYTLELQYKQFKWTLQKKASQVLSLHFALKKRLLIEELHEKQEQVKEWLHSLGIVDLQGSSVVQDEDEPDDGAVPLQYSEDGVKNRDIPSRAALSIIRPTIGRSSQCLVEQGRVTMQGYLNLFLGNLDIVNSREVCKFLEVSRLSFAKEYGQKMREGYVMVNHLRNVPEPDGSRSRCCHPLHWLGWFGTGWTKVWAVLKPGFLALLEDPFSTKLLDIIVFDALPFQDVKESSEKPGLAEQTKGRNPLHYGFRVRSGSRSVDLRTTSCVKVREWVTAIDEAGWCNPHRFGSFAPPRGLTHDGSQAQWFVDGHTAFEAIASAIETAKSEIFMTGWWLCPELYLRRPFQDHASSRLDSLLEAKAREGVKIYVLMYKEVQIALKINSMYSKKRLQNIHKNVKVLRYPDHLSTGIYLWSHHEKIVIVDYQICFIGGLDLCFGRYDNMEHKISDCPPYIWPGKDYYNPRESEPNSWEDTMRDELDRRKYPRMPWHDVHCALWGPPCHDIARHFVQRWNHSKRNKAPNEQAIPLLMPHHQMVLPHYMGSREIDIVSKPEGENERSGLSRQDSFSSTSPTLDIPLLLPQETDAEFASRVPSGELKKPSSGSGQDLCPEEVKPDEFSDKTCEASNQDETTDNWPLEIGQRTDCRCQIIRSVSQWSAGTSQPEESIHKAYCSLIQNAEHFIYIENQFFISGLENDDTIQNRISESLYRRILQAHEEKKRFRVVIVIPLLPGFQGGIDDFGAATVRALMHWQYRTISRGRTSILDNLSALLGPKTQDYISFYGLRSYGRLFEGGPVATSQVYVHSKLMIVDDRIALIGSSNINDRSLLGSRDSEIGVVIEDKDFVESSMNGERWMAGKFSYSLRCSLWSEHLGLQPEEAKKIEDPISDSTYKDLWMATAKMNTQIYQAVFSCIPNEHIHSRAALRYNTSVSKDKLGHTTIDLGIAPERLKPFSNRESDFFLDPMERLKETKGHLVCFPLQFMCQESDLRPFFNETEFYTAPQVFH